MPSPSSFFSDIEKEQIVSAITAAELLTSSEIRVHIENHCPDNVLDRAANVFAELKMHKTAERNGVLIYVALKDHKTAIIGDVGINRLVPEHFWDDCYDRMADHFRHGKFTEGICDVIECFGKKFARHFPAGGENPNELPNDISFG